MTDELFQVNWKKVNIIDTSLAKGTSSAHCLENKRVKKIKTNILPLCAANNKSANLRYQIIIIININIKSSNNNNKNNNTPISSMKKKILTSRTCTRVNIKHTHTRAHPPTSFSRRFFLLFILAPIHSQPPGNSHSLKHYTSSSHTLWQQQ